MISSDRCDIKCCISLQFIEKKDAALEKNTFSVSLHNRQLLNFYTDVERIVVVL